MRDDFGIGLALELPPAGDQAVAQRFEILDNAIVDQRDFGSGMRVRIGRIRRAMSRPARMRDARQTGCGVARQNTDEIAELALRPAPDELAIMDGADPRRIIPPIFHPFQAIDKTVRNGGFAHNSDDAAHIFAS